GRRHFLHLDVLPIDPIGVDLVIQNVVEQAAFDAGLIVPQRVGREGGGNGHSSNDSNLRIQATSAESLRRRSVGEQVVGELIAHIELGGCFGGGLAEVRDRG